VSTLEAEVRFAVRGKRRGIEAYTAAVPRLGLATTLLEDGMVVNCNRRRRFMICMCWKEVCVFCHFKWIKAILGA
jgi:hypothetical protein